MSLGLGIDAVGYVSVIAPFVTQNCASPAQSQYFQIPYRRRVVNVALQPKFPLSRTPSSNAVDVV